MSEYEQLVGEGNKGDFVITQQGTAEGFSNVSQFWMPNCLTFDQCIESLEAQRKNRKDIITDWKSWGFCSEGTTLKLKNEDEGEFVPTEHALKQALDYCSVGPKHVLDTINPGFHADEEDMSQLVEMLNHRKQRHDKTNKDEDRKLIFRTYSDDTLRAVLTTSYSPIDNRWFLEVLKDLIPGGMISHLRGDADSIWCNILLPDNVRNEEDSNYGGMNSIRNSEIGISKLDTRPSLFKSICRNGMIWDQKKGVAFSKKHLGKIDLGNLAENIAINLNAQIELLPSIMDNFLSLRTKEIKGVKMANIFAQIALDAKLSVAQSTNMIEQWYKNDGTKTAFGVIDAITRMSQFESPMEGNLLDTYAGSLVDASWDKIIAKAKALTKEDMEKVFKTEQKKVVAA